MLSRAKNWLILLFKKLHNKIHAGATPAQPFGRGGDRPHRLDGVAPIRPHRYVLKRDFYKETDKVRGPMNDSSLQPGPGGYHTAPAPPPSWYVVSQPRCPPRSCRTQALTSVPRCLHVSSSLVVLPATSPTTTRNFHRPLFITLNFLVRKFRAQKRRFFWKKRFRFLLF